MYKPSRGHLAYRYRLVPPGRSRCNNNKSNYEAALKHSTSASAHKDWILPAMDPLGPPPEINVLLLGDSEVGKSTFLS
jgi:GTP-binding protein EngB required for normal cell division